MQRFIAALSGLLGISLVVAAILGPLGVEVVEFHMGRNAIVQYEGGEIVTLLAAVILLWSAWQFWHNVEWVTALVLGTAVYVVYTMVTVVVGQEYSLYPDQNGEKFQLMYMAITALGTLIIVLCANNLLTRTIDPGGRWRTITMWALAIKSLFFIFAWVQEILTVYRDGWTEELSDQRMLFWLIKYLDLGFVIPISLVTILLLRLRSVLAPILVTMMLGFTTFMTVAIACMGTSMLLQDEPGGAWPIVGLMLVISALMATVWRPWILATKHAS